MTPPTLGLGSDAPEPLSGETLASPAGEKHELYVYSRYRLQKGVAMRKLLLSWVRVGH